MDQNPDKPPPVKRKRRSRAPRIASALKGARAPFAGKKLPGRPRNDGLPPIQRKQILIDAGIDPALFRSRSIPALARSVEETALIARIRYLAGRGMPARFISAMTKTPLEELEANGRWADEMVVGQAEAALVVMEASYNRVLEGKNYVETIFWLKCNGKWSDTPQGRKKTAEEAGDSEVAEIELTVVK